MSPEELNRLRADGALSCSIIGRRVKLRKVGHQWKGCCPFHNEKTALFIVYSNAVAHYHCFGCGAHGTVFDFVMATEHVDFAEAERHVAAEAGLAEPNTKKSGSGEQEGDIWEPMVPPPTGAPKPDDAQLHCDMLHEYCGADDQILYYIRRVEAKDGKPKQFYPLTFGTLNGRTGWHSKAPSEPRPLYRLNRPSHAPLEATILLCEGEKAADAAQRMFPDMVAMTWPGGTQADGKVDLQYIVATADRYGGLNGNRSMARTALLTQDAAVAKCIHVPVHGKGVLHPFSPDNRAIRPRKAASITRHNGFAGKRRRMRRDGWCS